MKHQFNAVRWSVWIGMAELAVAMVSFSLLAYDVFPSCSGTMETIVAISTFPASWAAGGFWEFYGTFGGSWAPIAFFAVLVLNANVWGFFGGCLAGVPGWSYRTFWLEPEHPAAYDEAALKRSLRRMLTRHAIYLSILLLYLHLASVWFCMFSSMGGKLPGPLQLLINFDYSFLCVPGLFMYTVPTCLLLFYLDGRAYRHLYAAKGVRAATWWSRSVVMAMCVVFLFSIYAFCQPFYLIEMCGL